MALIENVRPTESWREVKRRLWNPPNAVKDTGINLRPVKPVPQVPLPRAKLNDEEPKKEVPVDEIILLYTTTTLSMDAIAEKCGVKYNTVRRIVQPLAKRRHPNSLRRNQHDQKISELYVGGNSIVAIAALLDTSKGSVRSALRRTKTPAMPANKACPFGYTGPKTLNEAFPLPELKVSVGDVQAACADYYGITLQQLFGPSRTARSVRPRHVSMYLLRAIFPMSLPEIAHATGGRDSTTAVHGVRNIKNSLPRDAELRSEVTAIVARLEALS